MKNALLVGIGFLAFGLVGLLVVSLLTHGYCAYLCRYRYEASFVRDVIRIYGLISIGIEALFVLIGAFGNAPRPS